MPLAEPGPNPLTRPYGEQVSGFVPVRGTAGLLTRPYGEQVCKLASIDSQDSPLREQVLRIGLGIFLVLQHPWPQPFVGSRRSRSRANLALDSPGSRPRTCSLARAGAGRGPVWPLTRPAAGSGRVGAPGNRNRQAPFGSQAPVVRRTAFARRPVPPGCFVFRWAVAPGTYAVRLIFSEGAAFKGTP